MAASMAHSSLSVLLLLTLTTSLSISAFMAAHVGDEAALLAFKAAAISGGYDDTLASWNGSAGGYCSWEGVRCRGRHQRVVALSLPSRKLTGVLSPAVGNLSSLRSLDLSFNGFTGNIPASLGRLRRLHILDLKYNNFSGEFPVNLTFCSNLKIIDLLSNQLHGRVPTEIGDKLVGLLVLRLRNNYLTNSIPASLGNLSSVRTLSLSFNQLDGNIPPSIGDIPGILSLDLAYNNLSGEPPLSLYNSSSLEWLQLQANMLRGGIPADIGSRLPSLQIIHLNENQFTGSIPSSISNLTTLGYLQLNSNRLTGYVPHTLGRRLYVLQHLNLENNRLEADNMKGWEFIASLSNCSQLQRLDLSGNAAFTGQLPSSTGNLSATLQILRLEDTQISGSIPSAIGNLVGLQMISVAGNTISGEVPESIGKLGNLVELHLSNTRLSGLIPSSIGNLSKLSLLDISHAKLEGSIPASLGKLTNLEALDLSFNHLNGSIPMEIFHLTLLSSFLDLSYNSISGPLPSQVSRLRHLNNFVLSGNQLSDVIPDSIGECIVLQQLQLDKNSFSGSIPQSLWNLKGLIVLNLAMNNLSGTIPDGVGSIKSLEKLYIGRNNLSGLIPAILENLTSLSELDLSFNNLQGEVPKEGIFRYMAKFSITGNSELCGGIPQLHLAQCQKKTMKKNRTVRLKSLTIALATSGTILFSVFFLVLFQTDRRIRRRHKSSVLPPIIEEQYERVSYQELANGTGGFSKANLLGKGSFGAVYKCTFQEEGIVAAIKVFNLEQSGSTKSFVAECETLRRVRHRCLLKIKTCCSSINDQGEEFKALIFEFMPNGSLNSWLHPQSGRPALRNILSLAQRLDIAVDIMDALDYLHNHCQPPIIHCDVKPSNILLAEDLSARLGDFGISRILPEKANQSLQNSNSTIGIRGSIGYVAPEYGEGSPISTLGDIYSLGILLLEMFTGMRPTNNMFRGSLDLHRFSKDALPERIWEIADTTMWLHTDACDRRTQSKIENCLVSVIALGISCSNKKPRERTLIQDAAIKMHAIRDSYLAFVQSLEVAHD